MKKAFLIIAMAAAFVACNNAGEMDSTKGNTDNTDTTSVQDNTVNRDTTMRMDTVMKDTSNRR